MEISAGAIVVCLAAVFLIAFMRGAFGGGFAIVGIPLLSLVTDAVTAGALLAPLFVAMDVAAIRYWKSSTWSSKATRAKPSQTGWKSAPGPSKATASRS